MTAVLNDLELLIYHTYVKFHTLIEFKVSKWLFWYSYQLNFEEVKWLYRKHNVNFWEEIWKISCANSDNISVPLVVK